MPNLVSDVEEEEDDESVESMPPDSDSAGSILADGRSKSHDSVEGGSKPGDDDADSILSRVSRNLPGILRNSAVALNEKQICALRKLKGSFLNPDAKRLLSRATDPGTHNTKNSSDCPNTSVNSEQSESQSSHFPETVKEDDSDTPTLTSADIVVLLLDVCNAEWPGEEVIQDFDKLTCFDDA